MKAWMLTWKVTWNQIWVWLNFFQHFERVVEQKRHKELEAEFNAREKLSTLGLKNSPLLKQVAQTYTPMIFKKFHDEYDYALAAIIKHRNDSQLVHEYIAGIFDESREYRVVCELANQIISCSCRKFETFGILCCHAFKTFGWLDIKIIPSTYILKRWTREAKSEYILNTMTKNMEDDVNLNVAQRYRRLCPMLVELAIEAANNENAYVFVKKLVKEMWKQVQDIKKGFSATLDNGAQLSLSDGNENANHTPSIENLLEMVNGIKKKEGRKSKKRFKGWVEKQPKKNEKITAKSNIGKNSSQVTF
jgi:zinc finger SWIM domain-containing protein 3